jgi:hypothetical protein
MQFALMAKPLPLSVTPGFSRKFVCPPSDNFSCV